MKPDVLRRLRFSEDAAIDIDAIKDLRRSVGFHELTDATIHAQLTGSKWVFSAWSDKQLIGFVRAISDGVTNAYILSMMVHPQFQRRGIGRALIDRLANLSPSIRWVLHTQDGATEFYRRLGFVDAPGMLWKDRLT
jgi:ribosomal protein S18 acetylase RimI-like enzyme